MKIYFSHGKESGPWGLKIKRLADIAVARECRVESIDYTDLMDPDLRVERLLAKLAQESGEFILVGSSMGAYVSLVTSAAVAPKALFLMAPALYMPGFKQQQYDSKAEHIEIVHGWSDEIIPVQNSISYAQRADCRLHLISADHTLNAEVETVVSLFEQFLAVVLSASRG
jgi:predicted esterase